MQDEFFPDARGVDLGGIMKTTEVHIESNRDPQRE